MTKSYKEQTMSETKKSTWGMILKIIIAIATTIASTIGITSCIG